MHRTFFRLRSSALFKYGLILLAILVGIVLPAFFNKNSDTAKAATLSSISPISGEVSGRTPVTITGSGFVSGGYKKAIYVANTSGSTITNVPQVISLNTKRLIEQGKMRSDCGDIRIKNTNGTSDLSYWLSGGCNTLNTLISFVAPSLPSGANTTFFVTYGDPNLSGQSDQNAVFSQFGSTIPTSGKILHLDASTITGLTDGQAVTTWSDTSGKNNNATQATAASRPIYKTNIINGRPVVRFDGANDFMSLPQNIQATASDYTIFFVKRGNENTSNSRYLFDSVTGRLVVAHTGATTGQSAFYDGIWQPAYPATTTSEIMSLKFGGTTSQVYQNGALKLSSTYLAKAISGQTTLGSFNSGTSNFYNGDMAEVLIFNRALSDVERISTEKFLYQKYQLSYTPNIASPNTSVSYSDEFPNISVSFGGLPATKIKLVNETTITALTPLYPTSKKVDVVVINGDGDVQTITNGFTFEDAYFNPLVSASTKLWLKADEIIGLTDGQAITTWSDTSGNNNNATQANATNKPIYKTNILNGKPVVRFDGINDRLAISQFLSTNTNASVFIVQKASYTNASNGGHIFNSNDSTYYPWSDNAIQETFGTATRRSFLPSSDIKQYHMYNVVASSKDWTARINGNTQASFAPNTPTFAGSTAYLGWGVQSFGGDIAEVIVYNQALTTPQRNKVEYYLCQKYILSCPSIPALTSSTPGTVFNDAYTYEDGFININGIDQTATAGFVNLSGKMEANTQNSQLVSKCFTLNQPSSGSFEEWQFVDVQVNDLVNTTTNALKVQTCDGNTDLKTFNLNVNNTSLKHNAAGLNSLDIRDIPKSNSSLRFKWEVTHNAAPNGTSTLAAKMDWVRFVGRSSNITNVNVSQNLGPNAAANTNMTFTLQYNSNGAVTRNPILHFSLNDINGLHTATLDDGLADDVEVDYGNGAGLRTFSPLTYQNSSNTSTGEISSNLGPNATAGEVSWNLNNITDGSTGTAAVTIKIPSSYIHAKTLAARVWIEYGLEPTNDLGFSSRLYAEKTSDRAGINNLPTISFVAFAPSTYYTITTNTVFGVSVTGNTATWEDVEITFDFTGSTCQPIYKGITSNNINVSNSAWNIRLAQGPPIGSPLTQTMVIKADRFDISTSILRIAIDIAGSNCTENSLIRGTNNLKVANLYFDQSDSVQRTVTVQPGAFNRQGDNRGVTKIVRNNFDTTTVVNNYNAWADWTGNTFKGGEIFMYRSLGVTNQLHHTVTLDRSYRLLTIPSGTAMRGIVSASTDLIDYAYKDCSGNAPVPTNASFNHTDPVQSGWKAVTTTWSGTPFSAQPDENNPSAVVPSSCRIMYTKHNDAPGTTFGFGALMQVCDGIYCPEVAEGTSVSFSGAGTYAWETVNIPTGTARGPSLSAAVTFIKESKSHPFPKLTTVSSQYQSGSTATIDLIPGNFYGASQVVDNKWAINFYSIRDKVDLDSITGSVIAQGYNVPLGGNVSNINFTAPNKTACLSATSSSDVSCMAYWTVPINTQPPNGWGQNTPTAAYIQTYRLRLSVFIPSTTPSGSLTFTAESRAYDTNGLPTTLGANNAVDPSRWAASNYTSTASITVLEIPGNSITLTAPNNYTKGSNFSYTMNLENQGNTPNNGLYSVFWLPKSGINNSEFSPTYQKVYTNRSSSDILVEQSSEGACFSSPLSATWSDMPLQTTARTSYAAETTVNIDNNSACLRVRRNPSSSLNINPSDKLVSVIEVFVPNDVSLEGKSVYGRSLGGASTTFGSNSNLIATETANAQTKITNNVVLGLTKSYQIDPTRSGYLKYTLRYYNQSGTISYNNVLIDTLPETLIYQGLDSSLDAQESCGNGGGTLTNCPLTGVSGGGGGGTLTINIAYLNPDDGNLNSGLDEGIIIFWVKLKDGMGAGTNVQNCATITPVSGTAGTNCVSFVTPSSSATLAQVTSLDRGGTPKIVYSSDIISYTLTITNNETTGRYFRIYEPLDSYITFVSGSLKFNGATASDSLITANSGQQILNYEYPNLIAAGGILTINFNTTVKSSVPQSHLINNLTFITTCSVYNNLSTCSPSFSTNQVQAQYDWQLVGNGLQLYYDANNTLSYGLSGACSGRTVCDLSGNNRNGTFGSSSLDQNSWPKFYGSGSGQSGIGNNGSGLSIQNGDTGNKRFNFKGSNSQFIETALPSSFASDFSLEIWFRRNDNTSTGNTQIAQRLITIYNSNQSSDLLALGIQDKTLQVLAKKSDNSLETINTNYIPNTEWQLATLTYNSSNQTLKTYINTALHNTTYNLVLASSSSDNIRLGAGADQKYFNGDLASTRIYNRVLENNEIQQNFNKDKSLFGFISASHQITVPVSAKFESIATSRTNQILEVIIPNIIVKDRRSNFSPYSVTVSISDLVNGNKSIPKNEISLNPGVPTTETGSGLYNQTGSSGALINGLTLINNSGNNGGGTFSYSPVLSITVPPYTKAGVYYGTITLSIG